MRKLLLIVFAMMLFSALIAASCAGEQTSGNNTTSLTPTAAQTPVTPSATLNPITTPVTAHVVTLYSAPGWQYCAKVREFLDQHGVKYQEIDVTQNPEAFQKIINITHLNGVPQTDIDGSIVVGYDVAKLSQKLGITE
jgi:glutaredoxin